LTAENAKTYGEQEGTAYNGHFGCREKPGTDWKKTLQIYGAGRKSRKRPTLVVVKKPYGKCQVKPREA
jgi:hypothetical protein